MSSPPPPLAASCCCCDGSAASAAASSAVLTGWSLPFVEASSLPFPCWLLPAFFCAVFALPFLLPLGLLLSFCLTSGKPSSPTSSPFLSHSKPLKASLPFLLTAVRSALLRTSSFTTSSQLSLHDHSSGVLPSASLQFTSAPAAMSSCMQS